MEKLQWQEDWSVGNPTLDSDHKRLIRIIQEIGNYRTRNVDLGELFAELEEYVKHHFAREEKLMEEADLPNLAQHKRAHRDFEEWLLSVRYAFTMSRESRDFLLNSVDSYLRKWLVHHILETDMNYKGLI